MRNLFFKTQVYCFRQCLSSLNISNKQRVPIGRPHLHPFPEGNKVIRLGYETLGLYFYNLRWIKDMGKEGMPSVSHKNSLSISKMFSKF
jgi:hypothetical protein